MFQIYKQRLTSYTLVLSKKQVTHLINHRRKLRWLAQGQGFVS